MKETSHKLLTEFDKTFGPFNIGESSVCSNVKILLGYTPQFEEISDAMRQKNDYFRVKHVALIQIWQDWFAKFDAGKCQDKDCQSLITAIDELQTAMNVFCVLVQKDPLTGVKVFKEYVQAAKRDIDKFKLCLAELVASKNSTDSNEISSSGELYYSLMYAACIVNCTQTARTESRNLNQSTRQSPYSLLLLCELAGVLVPSELRVKMYGVGGQAIFQTVFLAGDRIKSHIAKAYKFSEEPDLIDVNKAEWKQIQEQVANDLNLSL